MAKATDDRRREPAPSEPQAGRRPEGLPARPDQPPADPVEVLTAAPFDILRRMREEIARWMGTAPVGPEPPRTWSPPVDVSEKDGLLRVAVQLPGMAKEDVKVEVLPDGLLITGEQRAGGYGVFRRCLALPEEARTDQAKARLEGGFLRITMPMAEPGSLRRQIPIEAEAGDRPKPDRGPGGQAGKMRTAV